MTPPFSSDELLSTTRSVRKRLDFERPVSRELIEECLELALQAPNGSNLQLWQWVVVDDRALIERLAGLYNDAITWYSEQVNSGEEGMYANGPPPRFEQMTESVMHLAQNLHRSPALVIPCIAGRLERASVFHQASMWGSILPATWSLMLALRSRGLGSAWTTVHLHREKETADLLGIPYQQYTQAGLFPVAYTIGSEFRPALREPASSVLHWNRW
ncbi:MAG: nitroreductase family protein [Myxococcota bacterium]|nr:nitroreductase family protein [Myxococcota bacterium]